MRLYEGMFLIDDARWNDNPQAAAREARNILEKNHAEVFVAEKWDERRLCYPIAGRNRAVYFLARFSASAEGLVGIERDCRLNDTILRVLILRDEQSEKLHKAGLLALRPGEPGEPIQSLGKPPAPERPAADAPDRPGGPRADASPDEADSDSHDGRRRGRDTDAD
ncbi:MAG TPA: 30S ribosomal protein S6 [Planctomycetota bacterium]|nr:30S ribosomal protein S6 [Planctomycetota bacterium]HRR83192.1 30S ribosomal protein S6 [Planctomycetota bacterium]HRT94559.1 30S ribosomal protein S6 [Planctomycetota bacterium]